MKERPILFSAPMVRAIVDGSKTVTRRVVKPWQRPCQDDDGSWFAVAQRHPRYGFGVSGADANECAQALAQSGCCPHGQPGDRLWVRETWAEVGIAQADPDKKWFVYRECDNLTDYGGPWKPSIFMPRRACRILLEITAVRVELLQDIIDEQCIAEGIGLTEHALGVRLTIPQGASMPKTMFAELWKAINGAEAWDANPWVWVVEFKRVKP